MKTSERRRNSIHVTQSDIDSNVSPKSPAIAEPAPHARRALVTGTTTRIVAREPQRVTAERVTAERSTAERSTPRVAIANRLVLVDRTPTLAESEPASAVTSRGSAALTRRGAGGDCAAPSSTWFGEGRGNEYLLLAEDNPLVREGLVEIVSGEGYPVVACPDGQAAMDWLTSGAALPALIVLDFVMPRMDGWAFLAERARIHRLRDIPVLGISASQAFADGAPLPEGVDDFLHKPFRVEDILSWIEQRWPPRRSHLTSCPLDIDRSMVNRSNEKRPASR
ncbi:MAG TPA: response regulator [Polyangiaceae bacterium]|jgi:CheY-like chemotaxis protein